MGKTVNGTETRFLHAGDMEIAEYSSSGALLRRYIPGGATDARVAYVEGSGTALTAIKYYHADRLGSVAALSDSAGKVSERYAYDPYGNETSGASVSGQLFRYTGRKLDPESGLYYYRARYYDPKMGRFLQTDPVGYGDQFNLYTYVANDPMNGIDPTGREIRREENVGDAVQTAAEAARVSESNRPELQGDLSESVQQSERRVSTLGREDVAVSGGVKNRSIIDRITGNGEGNLRTIPSAETSCCESGPNWDIPMPPGGNWANPSGTGIKAGVLVAQDNITNNNVVYPAAAMNDFGSAYAGYAQQFANQRNAPFVVIARDTTPVDGVPSVQIFSVTPDR